MQQTHRVIMLSLLCVLLCQRHNGPTKWPLIELSCSCRVNRLVQLHAIGNARTSVAGKQIANQLVGVL